MSAALLFWASASACCQARPRRASRSWSAAVATDFQAFDLAGGPTSTLGCAPGGTAGLVTQAESAAIEITPITMAFVSRFTGNSVLRLDRRFKLTGACTSFNQRAAHHLLSSSVHRR